MTVELGNSRFTKSDNPRYESVNIVDDGISTPLPLPCPSNLFNSVQSATPNSAHAFEPTIPAGLSRLACHLASRSPRQGSILGRWSWRYKRNQRQDWKWDILLTHKESMRNLQEGKELWRRCGNTLRANLGGSLDWKRHRLCRSSDAGHRLTHRWHVMVFNGEFSWTIS